MFNGLGMISNPMIFFFQEKLHEMITATLKQTAVDRAVTIRRVDWRIWRSKFHRRAFLRVIVPAYLCRQTAVTSVNRMNRGR